MLDAIALAKRMEKIRRANEKKAFEAAQEVGATFGAYKHVAEVAERCLSHADGVPTWALPLAIALEDLDNLDH
jgi:hypothetical protein